jgi:transposase InsO family protein
MEPIVQLILLTLMEIVSHYLKMEPMYQLLIMGKKRQRALINSYYKLVERSMSRKGDCWDNAVAESFFKTLKVEHIYRNSYKTFKQAELSVFEYIEAWYNVNRIHTTIKTSIKNKKEILINQLVA